MLGKRDLHHETREGIDLLFRPVFGRICSREAKTKFRQCDCMVSEKVGSVPTLLLVASREQIRPVENVILVIILLPVKYLLKLSGSRNFYRLRMTSLTSTNVFTISCLSIEPNPPPPPRFGKFISTARCKVSIALFVDYSYYSSTIRGLFVLFVDYSSTIRRLFVLFVDYSRTIRTIRRLFADYSYYSSTIRTIRFTILVLSIALLMGGCEGSFCRLFGNFAESLAYSKSTFKCVLLYPLLSRFSTSEFFRANRNVMRNRPVEKELRDLFPLSTSILIRLADVISDTDKGKRSFRARKFASGKPTLSPLLLNSNKRYLLKLLHAISSTSFPGLSLFVIGKSGKGPGTGRSSMYSDWSMTSTLLCK